MSVSGKIIISCSIARELIHKGFNLVDIKPNNKDNKRTVFIFEETDSLTTYLQHRKEMIHSGRKET